MLSDDIRTMTPAEWASGEAQYAKPETVDFWGKSYAITPQLLPVVFGKGDQIYYIQPLATRPKYYVICGDHRWDAEEGDWLNAVLDQIEDEWGISNYSDSGGDPIEEGEENPWPALNMSCGVAWELGKTQGV